MENSALLMQCIAQQLNARRRELGWSLDKTAQATGVSKAMLGQIERQESSPTIATLWKIATGLQCSFSSFIGDAEHPQHKGGQAMNAGFCHDADMLVNTLFRYNPQTGMEAFEITLTNRHEQRSTAHSPGVTEHLHVLKGILAVQQGGSWYQVKPTEQFVLQADQPHAYRDEHGLTRFIDIITYPR